MSAVQNGIHEHLLEDTETEAEVAKVCAFRTDRQEESRSLDSTHDENRIPSRYSIPTDHPDPARAIRIRDLVSMLHPPSRMVHTGAGKRGRKPPPGGEATGDQSRQASEAGAAGSGPRHSDLLEQTRLRALQHAAAPQTLSASSSKTTRQGGRSTESSSAKQDPVNLNPQGPSMDSEPVVPPVELVSPSSAELEVISSPHTRPIDLEEEEEDEPVPQSWEQRTRTPIDMEALIKLEQEGIAENDFHKSRARMEDINDVELEKRNPPIDRSRVRTYHLKADDLESPQEKSFKQPHVDLPAWKFDISLLRSLVLANC